MILSNLFIMVSYVDVRDGKRCERCSCKDFPTGVKILVENVMKGDVKMSSVCDNSWKPKVSVSVTVSWCFTLFFNLFSIEMSRITHFWCKFLDPKKAACVNVLTSS